MGRRKVFNHEEHKEKLTKKKFLQNNSNTTVSFVRNEKVISRLIFVIPV